MLPIFPSNRHICINSNCGILCHVNKHFLHTWVLCLVEEEKINILTRKTADSRPTLVKKKKKIAAVTLSRTSTLSTPFLTKAMNLFTVNHLTPFPDAGETSVNTTSAACIIQWGFGQRRSHNNDNRERHVPSQTSVQDPMGVRGRKRTCRRGGFRGLAQVG